jgi:hypothetical protein
MIYKDFERGDPGLLEGTIPEFSRRNWEELRKTSAHLTANSVEIRIWDFPSKILSVVLTPACSVVITLTFSSMCIDFRGG